MDNLTLANLHKACMHAHLDAPRRVILDGQRITQQRARILHWIPRCQACLCLWHELHATVLQNHSKSRYPKPFYMSMSVTLMVQQPARIASTKGWSSPR